MAITATRHPTVQLRPLGLREALVRFERWRIHDARFSAKTWAGEKAGLLSFIDFMLARDIETVDQLTHDLVSDWWAALTLADSTRTTRLAQLRAFLGYCQKRGWLVYDPSSLLRAPRPAAVPRERLDADELLQLPRLVKDARDSAVLALASNLALRGSEITRLRVGDVNLDRGEILVRIEKTNEVDLMPITLELADELRIWLKVYSTAPEFGTDAYLTPRRHYEPNTGTVTYYPAQQLRRPYEIVKAALTALGWETVKQEGVHTVRRSVARLYFDDVEGTDGFDSALLATMTLLHHSRTDTTLQYIGRDRQRMARDKHLQGRPFLSRLAGRVVPLRTVG